MKYLRWEQWNHNTSYHTAIRMTPYEAVYNKKPPMGLANIGIPREFWQDINTEDDIEVFQREIAQPSLTDVQVNHELEYLSDEYQSGSRSCSSIPSPPLSKFPTQIDEYENQILTALLVGTIVSDNLVSFNSDVTATTFLDNQLSENYSTTGLQFTSLVPSCSISTLDCVACKGKHLVCIHVPTVLFRSTSYVGGLRKNNAQWLKMAFSRE